MDQLALLFVVLLGAVLAEPLSRRFGVAPAVTMTVFGCVLAVIPAVPNIRIEPRLILPLVLPPLLYAAARRTSFREFAASWQAITARAVALVLVTAAAVAAAFHALHVAVPVAAAVALGALVAPPDPIAATALASRLGLPRRLVSVLEGEGLFNDVTAIVVYGVAVEAVVTGHFSAWRAVGAFLLSALVAVAGGTVLGWAASRLMERLDEAVWKVAFSLLVPFAAYGLAEAFDASGVLAVLVSALYLTEQAAATDDSSYRLVGDSVWDVIELLVSGFAFGLIGLELATVLATTGTSWTGMLGSAAAVVAVVVLLRLAWLLVTWWAFTRGDREHTVDEPYTWQETIVTWWAGMRGVASVALALALPLTTEHGAAFPYRSEIMVTAFGVVLFTLLVQGPTLPLVVRWTGVTADTAVERRLERELVTRVLRAELARLKEIAGARDDVPDEVYERLRGAVVQRLAQADPEAADEEVLAGARRTMRKAGMMREIQQDVLAAGRREALAARRETGMPPDLVDRLMRRLDMRTARP
ncbi:Sodium, potassium, lithium and rubidium/H(+) antiporter [Actinomadura rubteroloni]|uniref:Sodium, potassium, lithium and rubidium/H(+) antiporter n=1 Tax=Actinomadura rubteroloni TaxID=1926885 RepID=A0A2P4UDJ6_9ACTN|nr:Na+/H+ antiporter [Actinomadura rubteroloni]POM23101.1 Sodium, potassium, lithium and rubidium/H(+) antiporter [Actinomadura rubteroloni]